MERAVVDPVRAAIYNEAFDGTLAVLRPFAIPIYDLEKAKGGEIVCDSGTLVEVGDRVFVATAGHVIPHNPTGRLWILNAAGGYTHEGSPGFLKWRSHPDRTKDVGYLEMDRATARDYFGQQTFCSLDNIADLGCGRPKCSCVVVGTPAELTKVSTGTQGERRVHFKQQPLMTWGIAPANWPKVGQNARDPDPNIDVFFEYEQGERGDWRSKGIRVRPPDAPGMSGAGVWDQGLHTGGVWASSDCKLFAIQGSWLASKYLRATQIKHWIDLIHQDYPDLHGCIDDWRTRQEK